MDDYLTDTLTEQIKALGPFPSSGSFSYQSYLIDIQKTRLIVELPPLAKLDDWSDSLTRYIAIDKIDYLILQIVNMTYISVLEQLFIAGFKGKIVTTYLFARPILERFPDAKVLTIDECGGQLSFDKSPIIRFIPISFLPFPQMFMTYLLPARTLFSCTLFGAYASLDEASVTQRQQAVYDFHKAMMPSSEYIKEPLRRISHLPIQAICPSYGPYYVSNQVGEVISYEYSLDFYNTRQVFLQDAEGNRQFNYIEIANHILLTLLKSYDRHKIIDIFSDSPFELDAATLEIRSTKVTGHEIYYGIFKHLYAKLGEEPLSL